LEIYPFGSPAKGEAAPESDIDLLIIYSDISEAVVLEVVSEIGFEVACQWGEMIEPTLMLKAEYEAALGRSTFLWEVLQFGRPLFAKLRGTEWDLNFKSHIELAEEFLGYAMDALEEGKVRLHSDKECYLLTQIGERKGFISVKGCTRNDTTLKELFRWPPDLGLESIDGVRPRLWIRFGNGEASRGPTVEVHP